MIDSQTPNKHVAVIGAGPAGMFAARTLARAGIRVSLINRDIKPGGLAEYGIYPDKETMKGGLRKQFRKIMDEPNINYYGNVTVGRENGITLQKIRQAGFDAILVTVGAQGTKWLGLPGEELRGVYHAKDLVYHYNQLPPFSESSFPIGRRVALIGVGNVMLDIAHWTIRELKVDEVIAVARRGPAEVKFTQKEFEITCGNLDLAAFEEEFSRCVPVMEAVGQDVEAARAFILKALQKANEPVSDTRFLFDFLASPSRILGENGEVSGLEIEDTTLAPRDGGSTRAQKTGTKRVLDVDTVVFCIGDRVDDQFGLPLTWNEFAKNPEPGYPVDGHSYEAYDPEAGSRLEGVFLAGWAREASSGLVGAARKDGTNGAKAVMAYLAENSETKGHQADINVLLKENRDPIVTNADWRRLDQIEIEIAEQKGLKSYRFNSNREMLDALGMGQGIEEIG